MDYSALVLIVGCCFLLQEAEAQMIYKPVKIECDANPLRIYNMSCHIKAISWNVASINTYSDLIKPFRRVIIRLQVFKKDYSNQYKPFLIDVSINMCDIIDKKSYDPYGVITWKILKQYTNLNHTCPITGTILTRNAYLDSNLFPPFPPGVYLFSLMFMDSNSTNRDYLATVKMFVEAMEKVKTKKRTRGVLNV